MIAAERIEAARRANLPAIVSRFTALVAMGSRFSCLCPFHSDRHPSGRVWKGRDLVWRYSCWPCGINADAIQYVQLMHGVTFAAAVEQLVPAGFAADWTPADDERAQRRRRERERRADRRGAMLAGFLRTTRALHQVERELSAAVNAYEADMDDPAAVLRLGNLYDKQLTLEYQTSCLSAGVGK